MGPPWGPRTASRTQVGPMLAPWSLLSWKVRPSNYIHMIYSTQHTKLTYLKIDRKCKYKLHMLQNKFSTSRVNTITGLICLLYGGICLGVGPFQLLNGPLDNSNAIGLTRQGHKIIELSPNKIRVPTVYFPLNEKRKHSTFTKRYTLHILHDKDITIHVHSKWGNGSYHNWVNGFQDSCNG